MLLLEEDDFVLKESSILKEEFSMAIHPTAPSPIGRMRPNNIPNEYIMLVYIPIQNICYYWKRMILF